VPSNMKILMLPDREEFRSFQTVGPGGIHRLSITHKFSSDHGAQRDVGEA
jgi:hypothetical protein